MTSQNTNLNGSSIAHLSPEQQRTLLAKLLQERASVTSSVLDKPTRFEMSAGQQGLWYAYCRDPRATPFNVFLPSRIRSSLDLSALRQSIEFLAVRHESLRTTFTDTGGELRQVVHGRLQPEFKVVEVLHLRGDDWELQAIVAAESQRPFNLQARSCE
jgi:hypothetical protein